MLEIGSVVDGKYKILNVIGKGGMSVVYLAMNERINKQWAIKEVMKNDYRDFSLDKKEIEMMKKLKHSHLPSIVDVIESESSLLIVMDYIEGQSLDDVFAEQGAQSEETVLEWAEQLCDVLNYLHTQDPPIIYRDMKPGNVMLKPDGNLMLIDFGAAREYKPQNLKDTISLGTRGYAAPEQYREDGQSDTRTDIYCLGVMLFQLFTGENPQELRPITDLKPELSSGLEAVIAKCTQVKKEDRYQSITELAYALNHYWEYDKKYQEEQRKKLGKFVISVILTIVFLAGTVTFGIMKKLTTEITYDSYLRKAKSAISKDEEIANYKNAICLNPELEEGYMLLLENGFLDDNVFTTVESEQLRSVLNEYGNGKETNLDVFSKNTDGYGRFAYEAGVVYFYKFEESGNKKNAKAYFEVATTADVLEASQKERAKRLYAISDYYYKIGVIDEAGDASVTYLDYWNDMVALTGGNLVEIDNERTALVVYEELVAQIISRAVEFRNAGVTKDEICIQLQDIKEHLKSDFSNINESNKKLIEEEMKQLKVHIEKAEKIVQSTYAGMEVKE